MNTHDKLLTNTTNRLSCPEHEAHKIAKQPSNNHILMPTAIHHSKELPFLAKREELLVNQI